MKVLPQEILQKKRDGIELSSDEIEAFINDYVHNHIPDYQMSAWLMSVFLNGLSKKEVNALTHSMLHSGDTINFSNLPFEVVDKHSTGGVGDKTSLILAPIVACCNIAVPMISGRGLGHTGGTLDKLESIPGFNVFLDLNTFKKQVETNLLSFIGQTPEICPADKKIYALRDVTSTVESIPLISASIMSKKLAEGLTGLVFDIKCGSGAFMKTNEKAKQLAQSLMSIASAYGVRSAALITDMNQPLGAYIGHSLEIKECLDILKNKTGQHNGKDLYEDCRELSLKLAGFMIWLGKQASDPKEGYQKALQILQSGAAYEKFVSICEIQGGKINALSHAHHTSSINAKKEGYLNSIDTQKVGLALIHLNAGRLKTTDRIDHSTGFKILKKLGDKVQKEDPLIEIFYNDKSDLKSCVKKLEDALFIDSQPTKTQTALVIEELTT